MTHKKDKYYVYDGDGRCVSHRPPLKVVVNPILRFIQFWTDQPWVISSLTDFDGAGMAQFSGYVFQRKGYQR